MFIYLFLGPKENARTALSITSSGMRGLNRGKESKSKPSCIVSGRKRYIVLRK